MIRHMKHVNISLLADSCIMYLPINNWETVHRKIHLDFDDSTVYSKYSGHFYSGHSDIVATFPGTKYIHSIIFRSDIVANRI